MPKLTKAALSVTRVSTRYPQGSSAVERFLAHVPHRPETGCWLWYGKLTDKGYGTFESSPAHRVAYAIRYGETPDGLNVCHHCDNRRCVRPDHLFLGTQLDNMRDCKAKGRKEHGERSAMAVLTDEKVIAARLAYRQGESTGSLAAAAGVGHQTMYAAIFGLTWRHLPGAVVHAVPRSGERNPAAKLTDQQVSEIRVRYAEGGITQSALARDYGVSFQQIHMIVREKSRRAA